MEKPRSPRAKTEEKDISDRKRRRGGPVLFCAGVSRDGSSITQICQDISAATAAAAAAMTAAAAVAALTAAAAVAADTHTFGHSVSFP